MPPGGVIKYAPFFHVSEGFMQGQLWIVAAPSGGGKTSLIAEAVRVLELRDTLHHHYAGFGFLLWRPKKSIGRVFDCNSA